MDIKALSRGDAQKAMEAWIKHYPSLPEIDADEVPIRETLQMFNQTVRHDAEQHAEFRKKDYYIDVHLGLALYEYLWKQPGFSLRTAANDGFWRYLSIKVVPDIVSQRWGKDNHDHFWKRPNRIWLCSLWWYIHLSWQGDYASTKELLECSHFTSDTLLNFEGRNGRKGTRVETYRRIIYYYSKVPAHILKKYSRRKSSGSEDFFRILMKLNTAKMMVMEPALCLGGENGYVRELYKEAGVDFDIL